MDSIPILASALGMTVRLAVPIALTLLVAFGLRRLDQHWQRQAKAGQPDAVSFIKCWVLNDCSTERRESCPVYQQQNLPCWQAFRDEAGRLPKRCLACDVFRRSPVVEIL